MSFPACVAGRKSFFVFHKTADKVCDLVGGGVEREVACIKDVDLCGGHVTAIGFGLGQFERQIMFSPDHQKARLALAYPGLPAWVGGHVGAIVVKKIGLNVGLARLI